MPTANLFAQGFTHAVYETEFINRKLNLGGAMHALASRSKIQKALDSYGTKTSSLGHSALQGALLARNIAAPLTICLDMLVGTGRTHFAPGERPEAAAGESTIGFALNTLKSDFQNLLKSGHDDRLAWLASRFTQSLQHPCDAGLLGIIAGASSLPMLFVVSAAGSIAGAAIGSVAYLVQRAAGQKGLSYQDTVNDVSSWFCGVPSMLIRTVIPSLSVTFGFATRVGQLSLDIGNWTAMYLMLQGCRLATASLKLGISGLGATLGVAVGLGVMATCAVQARMQPQRNVAAASSVPTSAQDAFVLMGPSEVCPSEAT